MGVAQLGGVCLQGLITKRVIDSRDREGVHGCHTNCESVTRRDCLRLGLGALIGGGLVDALRLRGEAAPSPARRPTSCILIWMDGGPSHYETFDPKPDAPKEIRGEFTPIATAVPGVYFSEP